MNTFFGDRAMLPCDCHSQDMMSHQRLSFAGRQPASRRSSKIILHVLAYQVLHILQYRLLFRGYPAYGYIARDLYTYT